MIIYIWATCYIFVTCFMHINIALSHNIVFNYLWINKFLLRSNIMKLKMHTENIENEEKNFWWVSTKSKKKTVSTLFCTVFNTSLCEFLMLYYIIFFLDFGLYLQNIYIFLKSHIIQFSICTKILMNFFPVAICL